MIIISSLNSNVSYIFQSCVGLHKKLGGESRRGLDPAKYIGPNDFLKVLANFHEIKIIPEIYSEVQLATFISWRFTTFMLPFSHGM